MSTVATARHPYIEALLKGYEPPHSPLAWLDARRSAALERANALTVPTTRDEEWRFTDISPLIKLPFQPATDVPQLALTDVSRYLVSEAAARLVFVDGLFAPELSETEALPAGVRVSNLAEGLKYDSALIERHLARHVRFDDNVFAALNTCHLRDGALVRVAKDQVHAAPVHLLFVSTRPEIAAYPRCLVIAEAGSGCTVIEDYVALSDGVYFNNAVTEIAVAANARVRHVKLQRESLASFHIANCAVSLAKDAAYASHTVTLGARLSRHNLNVVQDGEGADARIDGLALISGRQLADTHTLLDHAKPNGK
ncbi:MAG: Fe-S cluster assembly protein SufD, partial [Betaproteobacteria bacterium RIFCSPLOWO2_12_FULL_62_58]